jgi:hypothetical protein
VPGLGSPLRSAGSNCAFGGGGLLNSEEPRVVQDRVGDIRPLGEYELYVLSGAAILGVVSIIEGARECDDMTVGWYDLRGVTGLYELLCKLDLSFNRLSRVARGDLTGCFRDLLREGPSGIFGSRFTKFSETVDAIFASVRNWLTVASSASLREVRCSGVDFL